MGRFLYERKEGITGKEGDRKVHEGCNDTET
jgi:hypothetical protein